MTKTINIDELEVGQIVAEPVRNKFRQVILSQGSHITKSHKQILKTWNIDKIRVIILNGNEENIDQVNTITNAISMKAYENVDKRCNWTPENEWEQNLYDLAIKHEINKLIKKMN
jgi:hypothetical protein